MTNSVLQCRKKPNPAVQGTLHRTTTEPHVPAGISALKLQERYMDKPTLSLAAEAAALRAVYVALNRNDIEATVKAFDEQIAWIEPSDYGGTYQGLEAVKTHLSQSRGTWAEGSCEPERFITVGDKVIVFIAVRVRLKNESGWRRGRHAAVWTFRNSRAIEMRIFDDMRQAVEWAGGMIQPEDNPDVGRTQS